MNLRELCALCGREKGKRTEARMNLRELCALCGREKERVNALIRRDGSLTIPRSIR